MNTVALTILRAVSISISLGMKMSTHCPEGKLLVSISKVLFAELEEFLEANTN